MSDLASIVGDVPTAENFKSLFEHIRSLSPHAASVPQVYDMIYDNAYLQLSGGNDEPAEEIEEEELLSELRGYAAGFNSGHASQLRNLCEVTGAYSYGRSPNHEDSGHSAFDLALPETVTEQSSPAGEDEKYHNSPRPHTLNSRLYSSNSEERTGISSLHVLRLNWNGAAEEEEHRWSVRLWVTSKNVSTTAATTEMVECPDAKTKWTVKIHLSNGQVRS